jgi:hypothetical protein
MEPIAIPRLQASPELYLKTLVFLSIMVDAPGFEPGTR